MADVQYLLDENIAPAIRNQLILRASELPVLHIGDAYAPAYGTKDIEIFLWNQL